MTAEREALRLGIEFLKSSFDFQVESTDRTVQSKLNAQSLRLFGLHRDVNDAHRAGANRLQTKQHHKHIFMGAKKYDNEHGVGILLNKKWKQRIIDTEYINERAISTTILVNRQRIKLMNTYFTH